MIDQNQVSRLAQSNLAAQFGSLNLQLHEAMATAEVALRTLQERDQEISRRVADDESMHKMLDGLEIPTHDGPDQGDGGELVRYTLVQRMQCLLARYSKPAKAA